MARIGWCVCTVAATLLMGCGGSTDDNGGDLFDGSGASTGSSGSGGSGASAGGSSPSSGGAGGSSSGAGGAGGSSAGGAPTGSGGSGPATGGTGGAPMPDPELRERCGPYCERAGQALCDAHDPDDCAATCRLLVSLPDCADAFSDLLECSEAAAFTCDDSGEPTPAGCELEAAAAAICFVATAPDPALEQPCSDLCGRIQTTSCPNDDPPSDCQYGCQAAGNVVPECAAAWDDFLACAPEATYTCGDDGRAVAGGCEAPYLLYWACVIEATQS